MKAFSRNVRPGTAGHPRRAGATLIEVLAAIFVMALGLLALLVLFPLGALDMAQAIKDDRTAHIAANAVAMSQVGMDLLGQTREFVAASMSAGSADPNTAAELRAGYEDLDVKAADLQTQLVALGPVIQNPVLRMKLLALQAQIKAIRAATDKMVRLLRLLEGPNPPP